jgi:hypothetical protein
MFIENICISVSVLKQTLNFGIIKIGSNELRFGKFKSQNVHLGVLYLRIKFHRNQIFVGLPKTTAPGLDNMHARQPKILPHHCHVTYWFSDAFLSWQVSILVLYGSLIVTIRSSKYLKIKLPNYRIRLLRQKIFWWCNDYLGVSSNLPFKIGF